MYLTEGISQINILLFLFDFIIETPFKGLFAFFDQWFVYLHNNDKVNVFGFTGISGDHDYSIAGLLDMLCKIAGTSTVFPGDNIISVANISESEISL